jgi:glycosyltransferase involved in cell wall biosynthesis
MTDGASGDRPSVTVLLPVYNGERFLREQVSSILGQTGVNVRLVLLDDGSTDNSLTLVENLAEDDSRVVAERQQNSGLISAVARLLTFIDTPYFALSDQDDVWDSEKLARSVQALRAPGVKLVYSDVRLIDEQGRLVEESYWRSRRIKPVSGKNLLPVIFRNPIIGHTIVATSDVAQQVGTIPIWLAAAAARLGFVDYINDQLGSYRVHSSNVVGPSAQRIHSRLFEKLIAPKRLQIRQQQRCAGLSILAEYDRDYQFLYDLYMASSPERLLNSPKFLYEIKKRGVTLGLALKESLALSLISVARNDGADA